MNNTDLAKSIGVDPKTVGRWLNGHFEPELGHVPAIAKALGVEPYELWVDPDKPIDSSATIESLRKIIKDQGAMIQSLTDNLSNVKPQPHAEVKYMEPELQELIDTVFRLESYNRTKATGLIKSLIGRKSGKLRLKDEILEKPKQSPNVVTRKTGKP